MALDPTALEPSQDASPPAAEPIAPAVEPAAPGQEPSAAAPEPPKPPTYTAEEWFSSPEYQSRKDKELAQLQANWRKQEEERVSAQAAAAERDRATRERAELVQLARNGDMDSLAKLAEDEYSKLMTERIAAQSTDGFRNQWLAEARDAVRLLADGDADLLTRLDPVNFAGQPVSAWTKAMADAHADKRVQKEVESLAEAKVASQRAVERNTRGNPDTAEMVGGHGGPVASLSLDELNARYAKAKDDGNAEEVTRLKGLIRSKDAALAGARR